MNRTFTKTLLALTISACAAQAVAQTFDISQQDIAQSDQTFAGDVTLTGQLSTTANRDGTAFYFDHNTFNGSLINDSNLTLDASGNSVKGLGLTPGFDETRQATGDGGTVLGDVRNNGAIILNNVDSAEGIEIGNVHIAGSVVNAGSVLITQTTVGDPWGEPEAVYLHGTKIDGDLINSGSIEIHGNYAYGLVIDSHGSVDTPFTLGGKLLNSGSISAFGEEAVALDIETTTSPLTIVNSGSITGQGAGAAGVALWNGSIDVLENSGTITASGDGNANAINIHGADFTGNKASGARGIVNTGTIAAQGDAIVVQDNAWTNAFEINQQAGLISSASGAAIRGNDVTTLNWSGGAIEGDILSMAAVNVLGQANFKGQTIASDVAISNGGSLNLASAGSSIVGDLSVAGQSGIDMHLSNATVNTTPYLHVDGKAAFANGSRITLSATPGDFTPTAQGKTYSLLTANSLQNDGLSVSSSSGLLDVASYSADATSVAAVVKLKSDQQVGEELGNAGVAASGQTVVNRFKNDVIAKLDANDQVYKSFANASTPAQLAALGKQLAPEVNRGGVDAALAGQNATSSAIGTRINGVRSGLASGETVTDTGVWIQALDSSLNQDSRSGVAGYSANASGVAVGADGKFTPNTTLGLAYSYINANVSSDTGNKTDIHGNALALYGAWEHGNWFTQGNLSYGRNDNDSKRYVAGTLAKGSFDSDVLGVNVLGGYGFKVNDQLLVEPRVAARYANVRLDGYTEHGSAAALRNGDQRFETGEVGAGLRVAGNAPLLGGTVQPEATLMAYHDLIGDRISQSSAFVQGGSGFAVTGAKPSRDSYEGSVGVNYSIHALTLGASYSYQAKSGFDADTVMVKARYAF